MPDKIKYDAPATVYLRQSGTGYVRGGAIWQGTLTGAILKVLAMFADEQKRASIGVDEGVVPSKTQLWLTDIEGLRQRSDFPRSA